MKRLQDIFTEWGGSRIGMGCWAIGGHGWGEVDDHQSVQALLRAREHGVQMFDTADCYGLGKSEEMLQKTFGSGLRSLFLATKGGVRWDNTGAVTTDCSPEYLQTALEASLKRLRLESIPLYYVHKHDGITPLESIMSVLEKMRNSGKIQYVGLSNFSANDVANALQFGQVDAVQLKVSMILPHPVRDFSTLAERHGVALIGWGVLASGLLTGKYTEETVFPENDHRRREPDFKGEQYQRNIRLMHDLHGLCEKHQCTMSQLALRWLVDVAGWTIPLFGAKTAVQVDENVSTRAIALEPADIATIEMLLRKHGILNDLEGA